MEMKTNNKPRLAILHYLPLEYYPPITNFLDYLNSYHLNDFENIKVYSTYNIKGRIEYRPLDKEIIGSIGKEIDRSENSTSVLKTKRSKNLITLSRFPFPKATNHSIIRLFKYLHFNIFTLIGLVIHRPNSLLFFESYSAWPAYFYTRFFNRKCKIFIHNHEYADKKWYATTMKQVRYFHQLEKKWLYPQAVWNSQTNSDRLRLFSNDHPTLNPETLRVIPNYPPKKWKQEIVPDAKKEEKSDNSLKLVYVGSLSFQSTYLKELCEWVLSQQGNVQFDVYAFNLYEDVKNYLKGLNSPFINYFEQGVEYNEQPRVLSQYDVGLILYKAHNQNYTFNAPNKLFEYLACDLDVWYPDVLKGPKPYITKDVFPKVVPVDFEKLDEFDWQKAIDKEGCTYQPSEYYCEEVYEELVNEILKN